MQREAGRAGLTFGKVRRELPAQAAGGKVYLDLTVAIGQDGIADIRQLGLQRIRDEHGKRIVVGGETRYLLDALGGGPRYHNDTGILAAFEFAVACTELIAEKRANPTDDMVSVWCHTEIDGEPMSDDVIISECLLLVDGGAETTRTVIASTLWDLIEHPDQAKRLRTDPSMIGGSAVEEFIRWVTPILNMARLVTEDHELHGQQLHAGDQLVLMYSSANRDEEVFDDPDTYDVGRAHNNHIAFGFGTHFCLGSSLARLEIKLFFEEFLRRVQSFEITPGTTPNRVPGAFVRGVENLFLDVR